MLFEDQKLLKPWHTKKTPNVWCMGFIILWHSLAAQLHYTRLKVKCFSAGHPTHEVWPPIHHAIIWFSLTTAQRTEISPSENRILLLKYSCQVEIWKTCRYFFRYLHDYSINYGVFKHTVIDVLECSFEGDYNVDQKTYLDTLHGDGANDANDTSQSRHS